MLSVAGVCFTAVPAKVAGTSCFHVQLVMKDLATGEQQEGGRQTAALVVTRDRGSVSPMVALIEHPWSQPSCSRVHKTGAGQSSDHTSLSRVNPVTWQYCLEHSLLASSADIDISNTLWELRPLATKVGDYDHTSTVQ